MSLEACLNQTVHDFWPLEAKEAGLNQTVHDFGPANYEKIYKTSSFTVHLGVRVEQYVTLGHICPTVCLYFDFKPNSRRLWVSGGSGCSFKPNSTRLWAAGGSAGS